MKDTTKNKLKNVGIFASGVGLSIGVVGFLYEKLRKDYNTLTEKYNDNIDFINNHDFYEKVEEPINEPRKPRMVKIDSEYDPETKIRKTVYEDTKSGLKFVVCGG